MAVKPCYLLVEGDVWAWGAEEGRVAGVEVLTQSPRWLHGQRTQQTACKCFMCIFQGECGLSCLRLLEGWGRPSRPMTDAVSVPHCLPPQFRGPCPSTCTCPRFLFLQSLLTKVQGICPQEQPSAMTGGGGVNAQLPCSWARLALGCSPTPLSSASLWVTVVTGSPSHPHWLPAFPASQIKYVHSDSRPRVSPWGSQTETPGDGECAWRVRRDLF